MTFRIAALPGSRLFEPNNLMQISGTILFTNILDGISIKDIWQRLQKNAELVRLFLKEESIE